MVHPRSGAWRHDRRDKAGETDLLLWLIENKFGADTAEAPRERVAWADNDSLRCWSARILTADSPDAIFQRDVKARLMPRDLYLGR